MASRQTRRSLNIAAPTYHRIKDYLNKHGGTLSGFLEDLLLERLGEPDEEDCRKFEESMRAREKGQILRTDPLKPETPTHKSDIIFDAMADSALAMTDDEVAEECHQDGEKLPEIADRVRATLSEAIAEHQSREQTNEDSRSQFLANYTDPIQFF